MSDSYLMTQSSNIEKLLRGRTRGRLYLSISNHLLFLAMLVGSFLFVETYIDETYTFLAGMAFLLLTAIAFSLCVLIFKLGEKLLERQQCWKLNRARRKGVYFWLNPEHAERWFSKLEDREVLRNSDKTEAGLREHIEMFRILNLKRQLILHLQAANLSATDEQKWTNRGVIGKLISEINQIMDKEADIVARQRESASVV